MSDFTVDGITQDLFNIGSSQELKSCDWWGYRAQFLVDHIKEIETQLIISRSQVKAAEENWVPSGNIDKSIKATAKTCAAIVLNIRKGVKPDDNANLTLMSCYLDIVDEFDVNFNDGYSDE